MYNQCGLRVKSDIMNVFVEFIESFKNLTPILWVSQIAGLIGLLIVGVAYLFEKRRFLAISTIAVLFFIVEQSCALLYSNLIVTTSCLIRNILMYVFLVKSNKEVPLYILGLLLVLMWAGIITYLAISQTFDQWDNYLPPAIVTMSTFTQNNKNEYVVKIGSAAHETGFLIYYIIYMLPVSILREAILIIAALVGLALIIIKNIKKKKEINLEENHDSI